MNGRWSVQVYEEAFQGPRYQIRRVYLLRTGFLTSHFLFVDSAREVSLTLFQDRGIFGEEFGCVWLGLVYALNNELPITCAKFLGSNRGRPVAR